MAEIINPAPRKSAVITGTSGFVGQHLTKYLEQRGISLVKLSRQSFWPESDKEWHHAISGADAIIHLAGIAHRAGTEAEHRADNDLTAMLARHAKEQNIRQFIYVSSIAAQSPGTSLSVLTENDEPRPDTSYGRVKLAGERIVQQSGCPYTILRPVAISGPEAKGNPGLLQKLANIPLPLPLGSIKAKRSLVSIENFNSAIECVLTSDLAINETFIVANPEPETIGDFIASARRKAGKPGLIIPFPSSVLGLAFSAIGRRDMWDRMTGGLVASPKKLMSIGWKVER